MHDHGSDDTYAYHHIWILNTSYSITDEHDHGSEEGHDHAAEAAAEESGGHAGHSHPETAADCVALDADDYNLGLRIGAIFIIMAASLLGVFGPIILHRISPYASGGFRYWFLTVCKFCK